MYGWPTNVVIEEFKGLVIIIMDAFNKIEMSSLSLVESLSLLPLLLVSETSLFSLSFSNASLSSTLLLLKYP